MHYPAPVASVFGSVPALLRDWPPAREALQSAQPRQKWLLPVDGTPASTGAVEYVITHADPARTHVHLLNVQSMVMSGDVSVLASEKLVTDLRRSAGERIVGNAKRLLERHGFQPTYEVVLGAPAEAIIRSAGERGCTKIVMGSRRTGVIANITGRSVSTRVLRRSHVPVTIIKLQDVRANARREEWTV